MTQNLTQVLPHNQLQSNSLLSLEKLAKYSLDKIQLSSLCSQYSPEIIAELEQHINSFFLDSLSISEIKEHIYRITKETENARKLVDTVLREKSIILSLTSVAQNKSDLSKDVLNRMKVIYKINKPCQFVKKESAPVQNKKAVQKPIQEVQKSELIPKVRVSPDPLEQSQKKAFLLGQSSPSVVFQQQSQPETVIQKPQTSETGNNQNKEEQLKKQQTIEEAPKTEANQEKSSIISSETSKKKIRCKFYPDCKNKDCKYVHPTQRCQRFPKCMFGSSCLYIHPQCKFGSHCSRPGCYYTHPHTPFNPKKVNPLGYLTPHTFKVRPKSLRSTIDQCEREQRNGRK